MPWKIKKQVHLAFVQDAVARHKVARTLLNIQRKTIIVLRVYNLQVIFAQLAIPKKSRNNTNIAGRVWWVTIKIYAMHPLHIDDEKILLVQKGTMVFHRHAHILAIIDVMNDKRASWLQEQ